ncbi:hypothetical protein [Halococcus agarilyticus]|uniref:hypothetical protein n=1 Tax=Halococcus agarilyticus TaxID=1232219 RepID=UPI0006778E8E|nr:hypothetical protein [Halococcus agarilyticus]
MTKSNTSELSSSEKVERRAEYEDIDIVRADDEHYNVCNRSHGTGTESDHTYTVDVDPSTGGAEACRCPDYRYRRADAGESCKHMLAVEDHIEQVETTPTASTAPEPVAADGGTVVADPSPVETDINDVADELQSKAPDARVVVREDEISLRLSTVVLDRTLSVARDAGYRIEELYSGLGPDNETGVVFRRT